MPHPPSPDNFSRLITGPVLILAGLAIYCGLAVLQWFPPHDAYHAVAIALGAEAYAIVAGLFVLLGLQYILGPRNWIAVKAAGSLRRLLIVSAVMGAVIVAAVAIMLW